MLSSIFVFAAIAWFAVGAYAIKRYILDKPVDPVGDTLMAFLLLMIGPLGFAIITAVNADLDQRS